MNVFLTLLDSWFLIPVMGIFGLETVLPLAIKGGLALGRKIRGGDKGQGQGGPGGNTLNSPVIKDLLAGQSQARDFTLGEASKSLSRSAEASSPVRSFLTKLLSGDKSATAQAIGPQAGTVLGQFESARQAASQNIPRGGGRSQTLAELPFQKAGAVSELVQKTIPTATEGLTRLAGIDASTGASLAGAGGQIGAENLRALLSDKASEGRLALGERERRDKNRAALGKGIGEILAFTLGGKNPLGGLLGKKKESV